MVGVDSEKENLKKMKSLQDELCKRAQASAVQGWVTSREEGHWVGEELQGLSMLRFWAVEGWVTVRKKGKGTWRIKSP